MVVSEEQETSVLSPTRTVSLTCKIKITFKYSINLNANQTGQTGIWTLGRKHQRWRMIIISGTLIYWGKKIAELF